MTNELANVQEFPTTDANGQLIPSAHEELALAHKTDGFGLVSDAGYLAKCQVDTPPNIVSLIWTIVGRYRARVGKVFDAGAGDGRFSVGGNYDQYVGYELDSRRIPVQALPANAAILRSDAFALAAPFDFDLAIGNPPYVRHHDLGDEWRTHISEWIKAQTGVRPNGWSNAYLYFFWLALIATAADGLVVYLVPFDWVSRPAAKSLRAYIADHGWKLDIYRFDDEPFETVLTTACVVVVDKRHRDAGASYFRIEQDNTISALQSPTLSEHQPLAYKSSIENAYARRGLSPGDQSVFLLTEEERVRNRLAIGRDVIPAVSTFRRVVCDQLTLTQTFFNRNFVQAGERCWLLNSSRAPSATLTAYLAANGHRCKENATCRKRDEWWKFAMPEAPRILYSSGFRGLGPKSMINGVGAIAVGAVCGIYASSEAAARTIFDHIRHLDFAAQVVAMSKGFTKVEVNQMNGVVQSLFE
jgi:hypothetical protein